jgi:hypothetical protein
MRQDEAEEPLVVMQEYTESVADREEELSVGRGGNPHSGIQDWSIGCGPRPGGVVSEHILQGAGATLGVRRPR